MSIIDPEAEYQAALANRKQGINTFARHLAQAELDARNWREVADHVLAGHYDNADHSTLRAIWFGLQAFQHPKCVEAAARVKKAMH